MKALAKADYVIANSRFTKELALKLGVRLKTLKSLILVVTILFQLMNEAKEFAEKVYNGAHPN